jgi:hypothetical protein
MLLGGFPIEILTACQWANTRYSYSGTTEERIDQEDRVNLMSDINRAIKSYKQDFLLADGPKPIGAARIVVLRNPLRHAMFVSTFIGFYDHVLVTGKAEDVKRDPPAYHFTPGDNEILMSSVLQGLGRFESCFLQHTSDAQVLLELSHGKFTTIFA